MDDGRKRLAGYGPLVRRVLFIAWAAFLGYYVLRVTVWAMPASCPGTVWESSEDPRCEWTGWDVAWIIGLAMLMLATLLALVVLAARRSNSARAK